MEISEIRQLKAQTILAIEEKRFKDAFSLLSSKLKELQDSNLIDTHYNLELTYKNILHYTTEGTEDPNKHQILDHLQLNLYQLVDQTTNKLNLKYSTEYAFETKRSLASQNLTLNEETIDDFVNTYEDIKLKSLVSDSENISTEFTKQESQIFDLIWTAECDDKIIASNIKTLYNIDTIPSHSKSLFISAILLNLLSTWNTSFVFVLFDLLQNDKEIELQMKSATALLIILYKYDKRLFLYKEIEDRLKLLKDNKSILGLFQTIIIQIIRTKETEKISQKLKDEILPEVVKYQSDIHKKLDLDNLTTGNPEDKNPEWSDFFADSPGLINKLEEISKWQMEGADVFLSTFQMLKHFPFFNQFSNWFIPFFREHPDIKSAIQESGNLFLDNDLIDNISQSSFLCNSDKYSLMLSIPHMPSFQRDMMGQMFKAEMEQMGEIQKDEFLVDPSKRKLVISNQYIQDLYRFFKVNPKNKQFEDIFSWKLDFYNKWFFKETSNNNDPIRQIGEFLFQKNYFTEATDVFVKLEMTEPNNIEIIQKLAYCHQKQGDLNKALDYYKKADILKPDSKWTIRKIAYCYKHLSNPKKALNYYLSAAKLDPDNLQTQAAIGSCYLDLENFDEALKYYFKVEYLDQKNTKVWRPIGWCSFVLGKLDQAEKYYQKVLVTEQNTQDLINVGHILLCKGQRKDALNYYQKSIESKGQSLESFINLFKQDTNYLINQGIDKTDIPILLDKLRYLLES